LRVREHAAQGGIVVVSLVDADGKELASESLTVSRLRGRASWLDVPVNLANVGTAARFRIAPADGAVIDVDYIEVFPKRFGLVVSPGSGVAGDADLLTFELPKSKKLDKLEADGVDVLPKLNELIASHAATKTSTTFRTLIEVKAGDLLPSRADVSELRVNAGSDAARVQLRRAVATCNFEGDATGMKVLVTGFQPFPADGWHENVSGVAVTAMNPAELHGAQVMRLVLPVEYDRAAAAIAEVIERCAPDVVISFGQGGGEIALEHVAYNLQDTGEISGGVPDNRGVIRAAVPIDEAALPTRDTLLPLPEIRKAIEALGETPADSTDPGRYICNNVMFVDIGTMAPRGGRGGFIHLPYTTEFDDAVRARYGKVVEAAIQATVDAR
jgi:pyroglutamyl-peptidase